jgi:hypothetical protein
VAVENATNAAYAATYNTTNAAYTAAYTAIVEVSGV